MVEIGGNDGITYQRYSSDENGNINVELSNNDGFLTGQLKPADLIALGYVPKPVWRDAVNDSPLTYTLVLCHDGKRVGVGYNLGCGKWFFGRFEPVTENIIGWRELPALPGKGEA